MPKQVLDPGEERRLTAILVGLESAVTTVSRTPIPSSTGAVGPTNDELLEREVQARYCVLALCAQMLHAESFGIDRAVWDGLREVSMNVVARKRLESVKDVRRALASSNIPVTAGPELQELVRTELTEWAETAGKVTFLRSEPPFEDLAVRFLGRSGAPDTPAARTMLVGAMRSAREEIRRSVIPGLKARTWLGRLLTGV